METVKSLFDGLGWLANAAGILLPALAIIAFLNRFMKRRDNDRDLSEFYTQNLEASWDHHKAKEFASIAIVDDKPADFPVAALRNAGYKIEVIKVVSLQELDDLALKDIIFLDIKGIVKDDPDRGGLHVIEKLRERGNIQKICAVSSQTFDPTATAFFKKADDQRTKPLTEFECQETIERFIEEIFQLEAIYKKSNSFAKTLDQPDKKILREGLRDYSVGQMTDAKFTDLLKSITPSLENQHAVYCLARIIKSENRRIR